MATSTTTSTPAHSAGGLFQRTSTSERDYGTVWQHVVQKNVQLFAIATPPIAVLLGLRRGAFRISPVLRTTAVATFIGGPAVGAGMTWARMRGMKDDEIMDRAVRIRANASQRRVDDYSLIGAVLGALGTTLIFMRRAPKIWTLAGGAGLGIAGGVITHVVKSYQEGEDLSPEMMIDEAKGAIGKKE